MRVVGLLSLGLAYGHEESMSMQMVTSADMKAACGKKIKKKFSWLQNPGAGMDPKSLKPYDKVLKDGYMLVACVKDSMYEHGDKFGNNKFSYKMGPIANSSIVHYNDHVAKEDREQMTHQVCFEFCRGLPDMGYFGISNGRDCYCTTFYKPMASDSSECDSVCEGDNTLMCGGAKKNSIFGMHLCADTKDDIATAAEAGKEVSKKLAKLTKKSITIADDSEALANDLQKKFGKNGDPVASGLMQDAKVWCGKVRDQAKDSEEAGKKVDKAVKAIEGMKGKDFTDYDNAKKAEDGLRDAAASTEAAEESLEKMEGVFEQAHPEGKDKRLKDSAKQYNPIMYFVNKDHVDVPQTCGGEQAAKPILDSNMDHCAFSCDSLPGKCVGFGLFARGVKSVCILYSKFESVTYYTGCDAGPPKKSASKFVQTEGSEVVKCMAKLQNFEGLNLTPKGNGKCKICLKEATKANRCYNK